MCGNRSTSVSSSSLCVVAGSFLYGEIPEILATHGSPNRRSDGCAVSIARSNSFRTADSSLENKHIEQALISYRKAMSLAPDSVQAQLQASPSVN